MPGKSVGKMRREFATIRSISADLSLDQVVDRLRAHDEVVGIVRIGSTAREPEEWSDVDLVVVLDPGPAFDLEFGTIGSRPADLVFTNRLGAARRPRIVYRSRLKIPRGLCQVR